LTDQFEKLGTTLKRSDQLHYTAFCYLAAAKCEEENKTPINGGMKQQFLKKSKFLRKCRKNIPQHFH
jgi:hypothetical protein